MNERWSGFLRMTLLALASAGLFWLLRDHWRIENGLHWVRDVTFDEDRSQVRSGAARLLLTPDLKHQLID